MKRHSYFLPIGLLLLVWLCVAQMLGSMILLIPCLLAFLIYVAWAAVKRFTLPVLLFFLPWAPLLKYAPGTISFYTIALLLVFVLVLIREQFRLYPQFIIITAILVSVTVFAKLYYSYSIENSYIIWIAFLLCIPLLSDEIEGNYDFYTATVFMALGIIVAALSAKELIVFSPIARYIGDIVYYKTTRYSGYYGDPNFYAAHIAAALGGVLALLVKGTRTSQKGVLVLLTMTLLYCGLLSASKMFYLTVAVLLIMFVWQMIFGKKNTSVGWIVLSIIVMITVMVLCLTLFSSLFDLMVERLSGHEDMDSFTTGRTEVWMNYLRAMRNHIDLLLLGRGFTNVLVGGKGSHNSIIQCIYQFGLFGTVIFIAWIVCFWKKMLDTTKVKMTSFLLLMLLLVGTFVPWLALDLLFFDDFFLMQLYACCGIRWLASMEKADPAKELDVLASKTV